MLNKIWFWLLVIGILYGLAKGAWQSTSPGANSSSPTESAAASADVKAPEIGFLAMGKRLNQSIFEAAKVSVEICITLIGLMAVWLGVMNVAQDAGLIDAFARLMRPVMRFLFPAIPEGHPAQGAILMNFAANMLGLDNAATPLGLKAMRELQELNPVKDTASDSMAMFLAINTAGLTIIPFTVIGYRVSRGSTDPASPIAGTLMATAVSVTVAILATRWLSRRSPGQSDLNGENPLNTETRKEPRLNVADDPF